MEGMASSSPNVQKPDTDGKRRKKEKRESESFVFFKAGGGRRRGDKKKGGKARIRLKWKRPTASWKQRPRRARRGVESKKNEEGSSGALVGENG